MRTGILDRMLMAAVATVLFTGSLYAQFAGGNGTANQPWQIANATQLNNVSNYLGDDHTDKHFILTADINLGVPPWNEEEGWQPIGTFADRFAGNFNGNNRTITGLTIERDAQMQGLFGYVDGAVIERVRMNNAVVSGRETSGVLVGYARRTNINNCFINGSVSGGERIGIIAGYQTESHIRSSYSAGRAEATNDNSYVGGLVGYQTGNSSIRDSYSAARVHGVRQYIGGLVGTNWSGNIIRCYATGYVSGTNPFQTIGGLIGQHQAGAVSDSYWNIQTTGQNGSAGGGQGRLTLQMLLQDNYVNWDFEDLWAIGFEEEDTYPYFQSQGEPDTINYPSLLPVEDFYVYVSGHQQITAVWSSPVIGEPDNYRVYRGDNVLIATVDADVNEYQDNELIHYTRYQYYVTALYGDDESPPSALSYATPVPNGFAGGRGTVDQPYRLRMPAQLANARYNPASHYILSESIDLAVFGNWTPIGGSSAIERFTGSFDGNNLTISNLTIDGNVQFNLGLFGYIGGDTGALIENLTLENVNITGRTRIGGLAAVVASGSIIRNCYLINVNIVATENQPQAYIGGLVGNGEEVEIHNCGVAGGEIEAAGGYVGGLLGNLSSGTITNSFATCRVEGRSNVGGFVGYTRSRITNSFALGGVTASGTEIGGFAGTCIAGTIINSHSVGRIMVPANATNVGGFVGRAMAANVTNSYWNTQNSGWEVSAAGEGRNSDQMRYPYDENTYIDWDFDDIWVEDRQAVVNDGYPYLYWHPIEQSDNPDIARNPNPENRAEDIPVTIDSLSWSYNESILFTNPVGFRVYLNRTGQFGANDPFVWIPYREGETNYSTGDILPENILYNTTYFWKVVPTTINPDEDGRRDDNHSPGRLSRQTATPSNRQIPLTRGDAENVPVWRFTTEINPKPIIARDPNPANNATGVNRFLEEVSWTFTPHQSYTDPVGFRVYFDETDDFGEQHVWIAYNQGQTRYSMSELLPDSLDYGAKYYWKVVPTTINPNEDGRRDDNRQRRLQLLAPLRSRMNVRGDAENVPVWSFTALGVSDNPRTASNPKPGHTAEEVPLSLESVSWDYIKHPGYTNPVGFRVYMNTTGQFGANAPYDWIDYEEGQVRYKSTEIIPLVLDPQTTYYWRVVPTTIHPDDGRRGGNHSPDRERLQTVTPSNRQIPLTRGDAQGSPTWRFMTAASTNVEANDSVPYTTELYGNYPNPFNPVTTINFSLEETGEVTIDIYNNRGQKIVTLLNSYLNAGHHSILWNGKDEKGAVSASGVYFINMRVNGVMVSSDKMLMVK